MERKLCSEGARLDTIYMQSISEWISSEADKRSFAGASKGETRIADWQSVSQRVEAAKTAHTKAQWVFIDHVVACSICNARH